MYQRFIRQGEDKQVLLPILKDNVPVQIDNGIITDGVVKISIEGSLQDVEYSLLPEGEQQEMEISDSVNNQLEFIIKSEDSALFELGLMRAEATLIFVDPLFPAGRKEIFIYRMGFCVSNN